MSGSSHSKKLTLFLLAFLSFLIGAGSLLAMPVSKISTLKQSTLKILKIDTNRIEVPEIIDSSRYQFSLLPEFNLTGIFQLAEMGSSKLLAIERFSGELFLIENVNGVFKRSFVGNIFSQLGLEFDRMSSKTSQKIDNAGNKRSSSTIFATVFDIDYAFDHVYMSVTLPSENQSCTALHLYQFDISPDRGEKISNSKSRFVTPCVLDKKNPTMWGGRLTHSANRLFLSIGEQRYDPSGFPKLDQLSISETKNENSVFGKVLEFTPMGDSYSVYSSGHRNAQGLYFSMDTNRLIESEHGPYGGDEVNLLTKGERYGWPFGTFGKPYPLFDTGNPADEKRSVNPSANIDLELKKFGATSGSQKNSVQPIMSWIPGVGTGNVSVIQKDSLLADWHGDVLVACMQEGSMHRLVLKNNSVILDEKIQLGMRVRDFIVTPEGYIIVSTDEGALLFYKETISSF